MVARPRKKKPHTVEVTKGVLITLAIVMTALILSVVNTIQTAHEKNVATINRCNVAVDSMSGNLITLSNEYTTKNINELNSYTDTTAFIQTLLKDDQDDSIYAHVILVDSQGGDAVAGEEVANTISKLSKPVISLVKSNANDYAYFAISSSDLILASKFSEFGSIGSLHSPEQEQPTEQKLSDGPRPLTRLEKIRNLTIEAIANNRGIEPLTLEPLSNTQIINGAEALQFGLIDQLGDMTDIQTYLREVLQISPIFCPVSANG